MKSGNAPILSRKPEIGSNQACVTFLSLHILASMHCPKEKNLIKCQSEVYFPLLFKCQMSKCQMPLEYDLKYQNEG